MDYEVQRSARRCAATGREFSPGEEFYSVLVAEGADLRRYDYAAQVWQGPPPGTVGWWKSQAPDRHAARGREAPNDVLLGFFDELAGVPAGTELARSAGSPDRRDMRYVLALLLVRRRVFRLEEQRHESDGREVLVLFCPRRDTTYEIQTVIPDPQRTEAIQQELARLLAG
jgi:hypothetical protein